MRPEIISLVRLGAFPSSGICDVNLVKEFQTIIESIKKPVTDDEAMALVGVFGPDDFFGVVWTLIHLIESAPGWPLEEALQNEDNEWIRLLKQRVENAKRTPDRPAT